MHELVLILGGILGMVLGTVQAKQWDKIGSATKVVWWYGFTGVSFVAFIVGCLLPVAMWLYRIGH